MNFKTTVTDIDVDNISSILKGVRDDDVDIEGTADIDWEIQIEARENQIKNIAIIITKIQIHLNWSIDKCMLSANDEKEIIALNQGCDDNRDSIDGILSIHSTEKFNGKSWNVQSEIPFEENGGVIPSNCFIDFTFMEIIVE